MEERITFVGLDVHKATIAVCVAKVSRDGEVRFVGAIPNKPAALDKLVGQLGRGGRTLRFACEAGPCEYGVYRHLRDGGHDCVVVAPSLMPRKLGERIKTDRRDATALGLSRGGFGTKFCVIADSAGREVAFSLTPGQAHELPQAIPLLAALPDVPLWIVGDRGYSSHAFREHVWDLGARPVIPLKRNEAPVVCQDWIYNNCNRVERLWARLKEWCAVATRYEKTASSFLGVLHLAATLDWIRR